MNTLKPSLLVVVIKNTDLSISYVVVALLVASIVGAATKTISQISSIDVVKSTYAFPCEGGIGGEYCSGYHAGAIQADKDDNAGHVDINLHPCTQSPEYCRGYQNGYNDEAASFQ
jgi:hypothetical protein